jgi:hypothetical protein
MFAWGMFKVIAFSKITPRNISIAVSANTKEASYQSVGWNSCKQRLKIQLQLKIEYMTLWNVSKSYRNYCWLLWNENKINSCWGQNVWLYDVKAFGWIAIIIIKRVTLQIFLGGGVGGGVKNKLLWHLAERTYQTFWQHLVTTIL